MRRFARLGVVLAMGASSIAAVVACSGESESGDGDGDGDAGAGGSAASGGSAGSTSGSSSGGASGTGGSSGANSGGASGTGGSSGSNSGGASGTGGSSGANSGGASATGGSSGSSSGGTGGVPMCEPTPVGVLCVRGTPDRDSEVLAAGDPLRVELTPTGCFSSSCTDAVVAECSVTGSGSELTVTGEFCLVGTADPMVGCTADCGGGGYARCEWGGPLEEGDYTVTLGDLSVSFSVPGSLPFGGTCDGSQF